MSNEKWKQKCYIYLKMCFIVTDWAVIGIYKELNALFEPSHGIMILFILRQRS